MPTRERIISILMTQTQNIAFSFTAPSGRFVRVDQSTFFRVGMAVADGQIELDFNLEHLQEGTAAEYDGSDRWFARFRGGHRSGVIIISQNDDFLTQANLIHEAVHASLDQTRSCIFNVENEAAAYIAEALFYKNNNQIYPYSHILETASVIAYALAPGAGGERVSTGEIRQLINVIYAHPIYQRRANETSVCNG